MRVEIYVIAGPAKGKRFTFDKPDCFLFGRIADAHLSLPNDLYVSRQHFLVETSLTQCKLRDLNSKNGVVVNGIRYGGKNPPPTGIKQSPNGIKEVQLKNGDEIAVGDTRIKVSIQPDAIEKTWTDKILYSTIKLTARREVALLILDLVQSTQYILNVGDTYFSALIGSIHNRIKAHSSFSDLTFLKCTGDGFLMVFQTIPAAFSLASTFLEIPVHPDVHVRMALHWGAVKTGPNGVVLGTEVHRTYRIEGVQMQDQIVPAAYTEALPADNRILITKQGLERLTGFDQAKFRSAGTFRLKGFKKFCELWVLHKATELH